MRRGAAARTRTCRAGQRIGTCAYRVRGKPRALARSSEAAVSTDSKATPPRGGNVAVTQKGSCAAAVIAETVIAGAVIDKGSASAARPMNHHTV